MGPQKSQQAPLAGLEAQASLTCLALDPRVVHFASLQKEDQHLPHGDM